MRQLRAIRIEQNGKRLFITSVKAGDLTEDFCRPDAWSPSNREGYQREPAESRFKGIADYMEGREGADPILPTAIVLNARGKLSFEGHDDGTGDLKIPDDVLPLYEVDGQHRVGGARRAVAEKPDLAGYDFPVIIIEDLDRLHEAVVFFVVNTRQKRVPTDLAQRIISNELNDPFLRQRLIEQGKDWIGRATKVVDILNETQNQPWHNAIGIPGVKARYVLKQTSFVQSLKPILQAPAWEDQEAEDVARALVLFWKSLRDVFPDAFVNHREYVIQKTVGVFPLHEIAPLVFERAVEKSGYPLKVEAITDVLASTARALAAEFCGTGDPSLFWRSKDGEAGKYTGQKGFRALKAVLRDKLPELTKARVA